MLENLKKETQIVVNDFICLNQKLFLYVENEMKICVLD